MNKPKIFLFPTFFLTDKTNIFRLNLVQLEQPAHPMKSINLLNPLPPSSSRKSTAPQAVICFLGLVNTRKSGHERTLIWARKNQNVVVWTYKFDLERTMIWLYTPLIWDFLAIFDFERTKKARKISNSR